MIKAIITRGIGFGGVYFIATHGFTPGSVSSGPDGSALRRLLLFVG